MSVANKITALEQEAIINLVNTAEFSSLPPSQIVPILADRNQYLCSESSMYRILRAFKMNTRRGQACAPQTRICPRLTATQPNQVHSWAMQDRQDNRLAAIELNV